MGQHGFIPRLESLRGVAAVLVGVYHCGGMFLPFPASGVYRPFFGLANGLGCVVVFFVISGFVLARSLDSAGAPQWWRFVSNRAFRLLPAAAAVVALLTILHARYGFYVGFEGSFTPLNVLLNMLLLKSDINGVMWSLTVELAATPLIFASVLSYRKQGRKPLLIAVSVLFGLSFVGQFRDLIGANLAPLYAFLVGVLIHFEGPRLAQGISSRRATYIALGGIALFLLAGMLKQDSGVMILMDCIGGGMLVLAISLFPSLAILRPLDWRITRFYGRVSYSYYLLHMASIIPVMQAAGSLLTDLPPLGAAVAVSTLTTLATALPALLFYKVIELPGISLGRALRQRRAVSPPIEQVLSPEARATEGSA
jgi:peptidoglycan/LPS O-acetylase OafA/YrhL